MRKDFKKIIEESGVFSIICNIIKEILFDLSAFLNAMNLNQQAIS